MRIRGSVQDAVSGAPLAGARIVGTIAGREIFESSTDEGGDFVYQDQRGQFTGQGIRVRAERHGYSTQQKEQTVTSGELEVDFALAPPPVPPPPIPFWRRFWEAMASHRVAIIALIVLVVVASVASYVISTMFGRPRVPPVVGKTLAEAAKAVSDAGLKPVPNPDQAVRAARAATVTATDPAANTRVDRQTLVKLSFKLPDLRNQTFEAAAKELREIGLDLQPTGVVGPTDTITETQPTAGSPVSEGTKVTPIMAITVPDVRGQTLGAAIVALRNRGLTPVPAQVPSSAKAAAAPVRATDPSANTRAGQKDPVVVWVAVSARSDAEATQMLLDLGVPRDKLDKVVGIWEEKPTAGGTPRMTLEITPSRSRVGLVWGIQRGGVPLQMLVAGHEMLWTLSRTLPLAQACPKELRRAGPTYDDSPVQITFKLEAVPNGLTVVDVTDWKVPCSPPGTERTTWNLEPPRPS